MGRVKQRAINVAPKSGSRFGPAAASRAPKRDELRPHIHGATARRVTRWAATSAAVIAVAAPVYWAISSGWVVETFEAAHQALLQTTAASGFALREIRVEGRGETAVADILSAVGANRGDPILGIDIDAVRQRLEDLPWIETASVERRFPDQLIVSVTEAEPMALWQRSQKLFLVSRDGAVIETANLGKYAKLLIIVGEEAPKKAQDLFDILAQEPDLRTHVTAAVLVGNRKIGRKLGLKPRARIRAAAVIGSEPTIMLTGIAPASRKALKKAGMNAADIDLFEINEAFAAVVLRAIRDLAIDADKVNVNGGAIALGHPLGATGAMILGTLLDELERQDKQTGLVSLCVGAGMGIATIVEVV